MKKIVLFILGLFISIPLVFAGENLPGENYQEDVVNLNEQLRALRQDSSNIQSSTFLSDRCKNSIVVSSGKYQLSGDSSTPGNSYYYGTNGSGTKGWYASSIGGKQLFTSDGTFTAPTGVTVVWITAVGGGGGGAGGYDTPKTGGGGGSGAYKIKVPYLVTPGNNYAVDIGAAGTGGTFNADGNAGSPTTFDSTGVIALGGNPGTCLLNGVGGAAIGGIVNAVGRTGDGDISFPGNAGANGANPVGGCGASGPYGTGGNGGVEGGSGSNASGYGAGGGGAGIGATTTGGNGSAGMLLVEY